MFNSALAASHQPFLPSSIDEIPSEERKRRTAELLAQAQKAKGERRDALLEEVIVLNIPVARSLAMRYRNRGQPLEELEQVACLALTRAVQNFEPSRGDDLLVFAVPSILGELKRHFRDSTWAVRPPRRVQELRPRVVAAAADLTQDLGREPHPSEIATAVGTSEDEVREVLSCDDCARPDSLDETLPIGDVTTPRADRLASIEDGFAQSEAVAMLGPACRRLKGRDRKILRMRFYEQYTQQQIADELGVTQVQVSRLLQRILRDLRRSIDTETVAA